jgi:hypothetical protein
MAKSFFSHPARKAKNTEGFQRTIFALSASSSFNLLSSLPED